jgi:hypothetical protein
VLVDVPTVCVVLVLPRVRRLSCSITCWFVVTVGPL